MQQPLYVTARSILIEYLNDGTRPDLVEWVINDKMFKLNSFGGLKRKWCELARSMKNNKLEYTYQIRCDYLTSLFSGTMKFNGPICKIFTKSTQKRMIVNDLVPGRLFEFIIRLLLEYTRTDWVDWDDKKQLRFKIKGPELMSSAYAKVNSIKTNNPLYYMKLMLSSLCTTGILIKVAKNKYCYEFNKEWYKKEVKREVDGEDDPLKFTRISEQVVLSRIHYPDQTIHGMLPCCIINHNDTIVYM